MRAISPQLKFFLNMATVQSKMVRALDTGLNGIGFNDFLILYHLSIAPEQKMRRVDLAERVSLTASGITRMLLPMEKIGLVSREDSERDGRVSYVKLAPSGKRLLTDMLEDAEAMAEEFLPTTSLEGRKDVAELFSMFRLVKIVE